MTEVLQLFPTDIASADTATPPLLAVTIPGTPYGQGNLIPRTGTRVDGSTYTRAVHTAKTLSARDLAVTVLSDVWGGYSPLDEPLVLDCVYTFPRPQLHYWPKNRNHPAGELRDSAPVFHMSAPDTDKLLRLDSDALEAAGVVRNDSRLVWVAGVKVYGETGSTQLTLRPVTSLPLKGTPWPSSQTLT